MLVVGLDLIEEFCKRNERARKAFDRWLPKVEAARWTKRQDAKATIPATDLWSSGQGTEYLIFDVGGNKFRVVARPIFKTQTLIILAVMSHDDYEAGRWKQTL